MVPDNASSIVLGAVAKAQTNDGNFESTPIILVVGLRHLPIAQARLRLPRRVWKPISYCNLPVSRLPQLHPRNQTNQVSRRRSGDRPTYGFLFARFLFTYYSEQSL
jgi:hypothetical protein